MAIKIPVAEGSRVAQQGLPGVRQQTQNIRRQAADFIDPTEASMLASAGQAVQSVQRAAMTLHAAALDEANQLRVKEAQNQLAQFDQDSAFGEKGWRNVTGAAVFSRPDSQPLTESVLTARQKFADEVMQNLGNEQQRTLFQAYAENSGLQLRGTLRAHEDEQFRVYKRGVLVSGIETASKTMALHYNDENQLKNAIASIETASTQLGQLEHGSAELGQLNGRKRVSDALKAAIDASLNQSDHASATRILQQFSPLMDSNDMLKAAKWITDEQERQTALNVGKVVMGKLYPQLDTGDGDRAFNIALAAESGGRQFGADGRVITSPKGAIGIAQVMPSTGPEAAKLAGLPWDETRFKNDPEYNKALGRAYFNKQLADFQGDLGKAYAAYNAGPGATAAAIKQHGDNWLSALPAETQAYVSKNLKAYGAGQGRYQQPTLQDVKQAALAELGPNPSASLQKQTLDIVEAQYKEQMQAIKQRGEAATADAMRQILANGGRFADLPVTVRAAVPVDEVEKVMNFAKKVAEGEPIQTDYDLWYRFKTDPTLLRDTNLMAFKDRLNDSEFKNLVEEQQTLRNQGEAVLTPLVKPKQILDQFMVEAGIDPTPKDTDKKGTATVGKIWRTFESRVHDAEQEKGKKLTSEEMRTVAARMFTQVGIDRAWWLDSEKPAVLVEDGERIKVPDSERAAIIDAIRLARPGQPIREEDIRTLYARQLGLL